MHKRHIGVVLDYVWAEPPYGFSEGQGIEGLKRAEHNRSNLVALILLIASRQWKQKQVTREREARINALEKVTAFASQGEELKFNGKLKETRGTLGRKNRERVSYFAPSPHLS